RSAGLLDADDVAALLCELGYPCDVEDAARRIRAILDNDRQALVVARVDGAVAGLVALDFMYYLPLDTTTCRITALVVSASARGAGSHVLPAAGPRHRPPHGVAGERFGARPGPRPATAARSRARRPPGRCRASRAVQRLPAYRRARVLPGLRLQRRDGPLHQA